MEIPRWVGRIAVAAVVGGTLIIRRALQEAASQSDTEGGDPRKRTWWYWRCECGAQSRTGWPIESDAQYNAQRHQWRKARGHPMPEVYSTEEEVEL